MQMQLRAAREASGKTQQQVAKEVRITVQQFQRYEYGDHVPNAFTAYRIAKALNTTVEALCREESDIASQ